MTYLSDWYTQGVTKYESVLAQALELTEDERELLMVRLGLTLRETPSDEYDAYWTAEIKRRLEALDGGEEELIPWDDAEKMIFDD